MYELTDINPKLMTKFYKAIEEARLKENGYDLISEAMRQVYKLLEPNMPESIIEAMIKEFIDPLKEKDNNTLTRDFENKDEAIKVYKKIYNKFIKELENSNDPTDKYNLELIHYIYDLLTYDKVSIVNGKKYLSSIVDLNYWALKHLNALEELEKTLKVKPPEQNIDTATNTNKASKDKVTFLTDALKVSVLNPHYASQKEEQQLKLLKDYGKESAMMARSIYLFSKLQQHIPEQFETNAIGELEPFINSDRLITKKDIYISWYAYAIRIYMNLSKNKIPITKALEIAKLSSFVIFPELQTMKPICSIETARKLIRERAFYKGLRLFDFSDMRTNIKRSQEEIENTEKYFKEMIKNLQ